MKRIILCLLAIGLFQSNLPAAEVHELRCEDLTEPVALDAANPQLSWIIGSNLRGDRQAAYQVLVASSPALLAGDRGDLWDSGKVASDQSLYVPYAGAAMQSRMRCTWKVRVWDSQGNPSQWSAPATWAMGLLTPRDWSAKWITASKWFMPAQFRPEGFKARTGGWADVDLGAACSIDSIRIYPSALNAFPLRFKVEGSDDSLFEHAQTLVDKSGEDFQIDKSDALEFKLSGITARYIRLKIIAVRGNRNSSAVVRQMEVWSAGRNVATMRPTREYKTSWNEGHATFLVDGMPSAGEEDQCPADACSIAAAPLLRKTFQVDREVTRAVLHIAAMGMADVTINGKRIADEIDTPPFTDYTKRIIYVTHEISPLLLRGENVIGAVLGNGFFSTPGRGFGQRHSGDGPPRFLAQMEIEFADGSRQTIVSDESWKWSSGPITLNDIWQGFTEDRRLGKSGWDSAGYVDSNWRAVAVVPSIGGLMRSRIGPPIRVVGEMKPMRVKDNHAYFNVLTCGWPRLKINGKAGQTITISGRDVPPLSFTLAGDGPATLEPRFYYAAGPIDLRVDGLTEALSAEQISIQQIRADMKPTGDFSCSNPQLNQFYQALLQTYQNYNGDQPMDPTREKQGWTQDAQNMFDTAAYLTDSAAFYHKWWEDFADAQDENGCLGSVVPVVGRQVSDWNSPWWSGVIVYVPWQHYLYYGDRRMLEQAYEPMRRYVDFLGKMAATGAGKAWGDYPYLNADLDAQAASKGMIIWNGAGDWHNPFTKGQDAVPTPMTTMPAWFDYAMIVSKTAALLGKDADAAKYAGIAKEVRDRFNAAYFHPETGLYGDKADSQTGQVLPLALGLTPPEKQDLTYRRLIDAIHARRDHVGTGFVALPFLLQTLTEHRESQLANKMVNQPDFPGWKTLMHDGILGEDWHGAGAQMPSTGGAIGMWMFQSVLGIRPDPAGPGFQKFILAPQPDAPSGLTWARGHFDSPFGRINSDWKCEGGQFTLHATIPVNATATVYIPADDQKSVMEAGSPADGAAGVHFIKTGRDFAVYEVSSGDYQFTAKLPQP